MIDMPIPILLYHSISDQASPRFRPWTVPPQEFDAQMRFLAEHRFSPMTVTEFVDGISRKDIHFPANPIVITFDDGFQDFYGKALPILQQYRFPATLYVVSSGIGGTSRWLAGEGEGDRPMLSWNEITELPRYGIEIGAHSHTHPQLDTLPVIRADEEIRISKRILEDHLGNPVQSFAYPHGYHDRKVKNLVRQALFTSACAVNHAMSNINDDRFALARIMVTNNLSLEAFSSLLRGENLLAAERNERIQTMLWRLVRRTMVQLRGAETIHRVEE